MSKPILEVLVIGAGFSGICSGVKLLKNDIKNFAIFDKSKGIGGTWWANKYPGAACDVPSHLYCYSFEPNPNWSRLYSTQPEIQNYIEHCVKRYGLQSYLNLGREITTLNFDENQDAWEAVFKDGEIITSRFIINGSGGLHIPNIPEFEGADIFEGATMHTAAWDQSFDPTGKNIAVIGSAASAIQVVPELAVSAAKINLFQRTPNYIAPRNDFEYSEKAKHRFRKMPWLAKINRLKIFMGMEMLLYPIITKEKFRRKRAALVKSFIRMMVKKTNYHASLIPAYEMGCKRILISDNFLPSLNRDNVELITTPIKILSKSSVVTEDYKKYPVDAIIFATGFDLEKHLYGIEITGQNGLTLRDIWDKGAQAYRGVMISSFPNYFTVTGPNTGVGTTSVIFMIEQTTTWIIKCIKKAGRAKTVSVTMEAYNEYNKNMQSSFKGTVWTTGCKSWYRKADGRVETLYPYDARSFKKLMTTIDLKHIKFTKSSVPQATNYA